MRHIVYTLLFSLTIVEILAKEDSPQVTINIAGHVEKGGDYLVDRRIKQDLDDLIQMAGGFNPSLDFKAETSSSVAWIERNSKRTGVQLIIIDYQNKMILSQRRVEAEKWRLERYDWNKFEYLPGDVLFVTTSRKSLDLASYPIRYVEDTGWTGFEKLRYSAKHQKKPRP